MTGDSAYWRYGDYLLLRRLESDELSETWRAAELESSNISRIVAFLRFKGGRAGSFAAALHSTDALSPEDAGSTIVKGQEYKTIDGDPVIVWDYTGGRSLQRVLEAAAGNAHEGPNPVPLDQTLAIAEKLATSLEAASKVQKKGAKVLHGALLPRFVWIAEDGDVRTLGHGLGKAVAEAAAGTLDERYIAPELRSGETEPTPASEVYGVGAILYAMLSGEPPPLDGSLDFEKAHAYHGEALPAEIEEIMTRSLRTSPDDRYLGPGALYKALQTLTKSGDYAPTTFNLAFYIHSLMRDELDAEPAEIEKEKGLDPALIPMFTPSDRPSHAPPPTRPETEHLAEPEDAPSTAPAMFASDDAGESKNRLPMIAAVVAVLALAAAGGWYFTAGPGGGTSSPEEVEQTAELPPPANPPVTEAMVAIEDTGDETLDILPEDGENPEPGGESDLGPADDAELSEADREALIQAEVERQYQERVAQLQAELDRQLRAEEERKRREAAAERRRQEQARQAAAQPAQTPPTSAAAPVEQEEPEPVASAEELDRQTLESRRQEQTALPETPSETTAAPVTTAETQTTAPVEPEPEPEVREGDLVSFGELDTKPAFARQARLEYPPLAKRQKVEDTVLVSVLISETGEVLEAKVIKGEARNLGFDEAALKAVRRSTFTPGIKDGKRVKTWYVFPVAFKLSG